MRRMPEEKQHPNDGATLSMKKNKILPRVFQDQINDDDDKWNSLTKMQQEQSVETITGRRNTNSAPKKLFGVDQQQQQLFDAFQRCLDVDKRQSELSVIAGLSGSGKTVLAHTLQEYADYLVMGKCDQIQQGSEPFGPFIAALSRLAEEIFQKESNIIQSFQLRAQQAIEEETEVHLLVDTVPALANFFPHVNPKEQRSRSTTAALQRSNALDNPTIQVLCKFLRGICSPDCSIVLIIDDVQWIDSSSLELLETLASQTNMTKWMLLATCRDDEVTSDHPFSKTLTNLKRKKDVSVNNIKLGSLSIETISTLVVDKFPTLVGEDLEALSTVLHTHTKGNAFFTTQLLHRLKNSGWKPPDTQNCEGGEEWNSVFERSMIDHLTALDCDTLVDIIVADTANETPFMKEVITSASCLGSNFVTSHLLAVVNGSTTEEQVRQALSTMERKEFIRPRLDGHGWSWVHDKFQKAAYLLIHSARRKLFHLTIGRRLLSTLGKEELWQYLFIVVSQFCIALKKIEDDEAESIAKLLLQAGQKSAQSSSFGKAVSYFTTGMSLLKTNNWESQYELSVQLYSAAAEMECCRGNIASADKLVNVILRHTHTIKDQLRAYETKFTYLSQREEHNQAICLALNVLDQLGEKFPRNPGMPKVVYELMSTKWALAKKSLGDIMNLKPLTDWKKLAVLRILQLAFLPLLRAGKELLAPIVICRSIKITLKHGLSGIACHNFMAMAVILQHPMGYLEDAHKCMNIGLGIVDNYPLEEFALCRIGLIQTATDFSFRAPLRGSLERYKRTAHLGLVTGDIDMACLTLRAHDMIMICCGEPLGMAASMMQEHFDNFQRWGQPAHCTSILPLKQVVENLMNPNIEDPCTFTGPAMIEESWIEQAKLANDDFRIIIFWLFKIFVAMYLGEHEKARDFLASLMKNNLGTAGANLFQLYYLDSLVHIVSARDEKSNGGRGRSKKYQSSLKKLRLYGKNCPANVDNKILLVEAEAEVLKHGKSGKAVSLFQQSIGMAKENKIIQEEAYAYERCAIAMLEGGGDDVPQALEYFERAKNLYEQWGSPVKVLQLMKYVEEKAGVRMTSSRNLMVSN